MGELRVMTSTALTNREAVRGKGGGGGGGSDQPVPRGDYYTYSILKHVFLFLVSIAPASATQ